METMRGTYLMKVTGLLLLASATLMFANPDPQSNNRSLPPELVPAKTLPVPRDVSPEMQRIIAAPRNPNWNILWKTGEEWRAAANTQAAKTMQTLPASRQRLHVTTQPGTMGGVRIYTVPSGAIPPEHRDKLLLHAHGGCYVLFPGYSGTRDNIPASARSTIQTVSAEYVSSPRGHFS